MACRWLMGGECKLVTGIDDHSRFVVIATVVPALSVFAKDRREGQGLTPRGRGGCCTRPPTAILKQSEGAGSVLVDHEELYRDVVGRSQVQMMTEISLDDLRDADVVLGEPGTPTLKLSAVCHG